MVEKKRFKRGEGPKVKERTARAIETGLRFVGENHDVFADRVGNRGFCGCALAIASEGLIHLIAERQVRTSMNAHGDVVDEKMIKSLKRKRLDPIVYFATVLGISVPLAQKIDALHRQERISAAEIAQRLRRNEI